MHAFTEMVRGIQLYQKSEYKPVSSKHIEVWSVGQTSLRRIGCDHGATVGGGIFAFSYHLLLIAPAFWIYVPSEVWRNGSPRKIWMFICWIGAI